MLRYMAVVGALCAACAPFLSGGVPRPDVDAAVIGAAVGVVLAALLAVVGDRAARVVAVVAAVCSAAAVWWLLASDLLIGLTGADLPVLAVGSLAVAVGAVGLVGRRPEAGGDRRGRWRVRPSGVAAAVVVAVAAWFAPVGAEAVIVRSETRDARDFAPEPLVERPGGRQWAWQPPADVVDVAPIPHGVAVATRDGAVVGLNGTDGRVEWRYARPGAPVGAVVASVDRRTVVVTFRSVHDTRAQSVVVLDADTGTPRFGMVVRSVLVETGQVQPGARSLTVRDGEVVTGYDVVNGEPRWRWSPPDGCTSWFGQVAWGRTTVLVPTVCAGTLGVTALDEATGEQRWQHEVPRVEADDERQDVRLHGTPDGSVVLFQAFGAARTPDAVPDGVLDADTGRVLSRPERPWTVRTDVGVTPLVEDSEGGRVTGLAALDPATGATTPLPVDDCPLRTADLTTATTYVRACADNGRELTLVTHPLDSSPPTSTPVRLDGSGARGRPDVLLVAAPGALVVTRTSFGGTPAPVVGLR
ncbi:putative pyrroloquinoline-quinone binding quinoprotein [Saccharothrix saharensis]|uniref:Putative pyrroloquinoline-quinone binding quinoprotein n=1 Tax=Saccharothrix saharensis TaxID=571190 RepID=A0A543J569_9PSEU|nr:PQQ-binding-like beta-propeller repeat protein [Saccharothrix saharensis]TQM77966.1 putative pyrroloquinoline-quinone binding quinoprotein [Saccharothrix saharensis]